MKTIFKADMKVYDQFFEPDKEGKVEYTDVEHNYISVIFGNERSFYTLEGCRGKNEIKTLSTAPYKIEGFEQKAPVPTYEEAVKWCIENLKDYRECVCTEYVNEKQENALEALRKLIIFRDYYNEGWKPNWLNNNEDKFVILVQNDDIVGQGIVIIEESYLSKQKKLEIDF